MNILVERVEIKDVRLPGEFMYLKTLLLRFTLLQLHTYMQKLLACVGKKSALAFFANEHKTNKKRVIKFCSKFKLTD
jgi:hypothetical protein